MTFVFKAHPTSAVKFVHGGPLQQQIAHFLNRGRIAELFQFMEEHQIESFYPTTFFLLTEGVINFVLAFPYGCFKHKAENRDLSGTDIYGTEWGYGQLNKHSTAALLELVINHKLAVERVANVIDVEWIPAKYIESALRNCSLNHAFAADWAVFKKLCSQSITGLNILPLVDYACLWFRHPCSQSYGLHEEEWPFERPTWTKASHLKMDGRFKSIAKTVLLMQRCRRFEFPLPKDLVPILLGHLLNSHIDQLAFELDQHALKINELYNETCWATVSFVISATETWTISARDKEGISICLEAEAGRRYPKSEKMAWRLLAYAAEHWNVFFLNNRFKSELEGLLLQAEAGVTTAIETCTRVTKRLLATPHHCLLDLR